MSADLQIHVLEGATEDDLAALKSHCLGSKHYSAHRASSVDWDAAFSKIAETPSVFVGEVSWLKAAVLEDEERFVPDPVGAVAEAIGEDLPTIDDELIGRVGNALALKNQTGYSVSVAEPVIEFLESHRGKRVFTVSW